MEAQVQKVVDAIWNVIDGSETYSFEENPSLVYSLLFKKLFQGFENFKYTELPFWLKNGWSKFVNTQFSLEDEDKDFVSIIEQVLDDAIAQNGETDIIQIFGSLLLLNKENDKNYLDNTKVLLNTVWIIGLWNGIEDSDCYTTKKNPYPYFKILLDKFFESVGQGVDALPSNLKKFWDDKINVQLELEGEDDFVEELTEAAEKFDCNILEVASCLMRKYDKVYWRLASDERPAVSSNEWVDFVAKLRKFNATKKLWDIVNSSYTYSFKKEPLPVFHILADYYMSNHVFEEEMPQKWSKTLDELKQNTQNCINNTAKDLFVKFKETLESEVNQDERLLSDVVEFFVDKYAELYAEEGGEYILPEELVHFIYRYAAGIEGCATEEAIYNPFAGLGAYGKEHAKCLNEQLNDQVECCDDLNDVKDSYRKDSWYHGVESNQTNRLIGSVRLLVNNPTNLEQMFITSDDSIGDDIDGFSGGWTFIATPPIASKDVSTDTLVDIMTRLVNKFINADGMGNAFFVLPKAFCSDKAYYKLRQKLVNMGILGCVMELPKEIFKLPFEAVLVCVDKCSDGYSQLSNDSCFVKFIDARAFVDEDDKSIFSVYVDWGLWDACLDEPEVETPFYVKVDNGIVSRYDYSLLPELYIPKPVERKPGEVSIHLKEFLSQEVGENREEKEGLFISDRCFRNDSKVLFKDIDFERCSIERKSPKLVGEYLVVTFMRDKFLMCKTLPNLSFCLKDNQVAFKLKEDSLLSLDYVISAILRGGYLNRLSMCYRDFGWNGYGYSGRDVVDNILNSEILIHLDKTNQDETLSELRAEYERIKAAEEEAEKQRSAHREVSSDISHMLGTTFDRIGDGLAELKDIDEAKEVMMQMKDSFDYMKRLIDSVGKDFTKATMKISEKNVNDFIVAYCEGWKNYGKNTFDVRYESSVSDETTFKIDDVLMKVLLDTLLDNAYRHGFDRYKSPDHQVKIATSFVSMDKKKYVLLSVANSGKPFPEDFTIEKYISRGEFCGESGRTGLGGNHVYSIAKRHGGFVCLTSSEDWNVIVEILLPVEYYDESETDNFVTYGNAKECL